MSAPRSRDLRLLAGAAGLSALGDFMAIFPLLLHVQQSTGSAFAVSGLILALWGPVVLAAVPAGAIVDRFENRAVLIAVSFVQAAAVAAMVFATDALWALLPLMALLGTGVAISQPAEFALVPAAAGPGVATVRANGTMETLRGLGFTAGPIVGGLLGAAGLLELALALDAASFVVVGLAAIALRARRRPREEQPGAPVRSRDGFAFVAGEGELVLALGGAIAALALFSMSATAEPFFVTDVLGAGNVGYGLLIAAWTAGMAAGASGIAHRVATPQLAAGALVAVTVQGLGIAGGALASVLGAALIGFALGGIAHGAKNVLLRTLVHERAPEALRGRVFAAYNGARNGAELAALLLGGLVVTAFGARAALLAAGVGPAALGALCLLLLTMRRRAAAVALTPDEGITHARLQG